MHNNRLVTRRKLVSEQFLTKTKKIPIMCHHAAYTVMYLQAPVYGVYTVV